MTLQNPQVCKRAVCFFLMALATPAAWAQQTINVDFSLPIEVTANDPLEVAGPVQLADGTWKIITIEAATAAKGGGGNELVEYNSPDGINFVRQALTAGAIFSLSKHIGLVNGLLFFTVVQDFNVFMYRWDPLVAAWVVSQLTTSGEVASADLALTGTLLTLALFNNTIALWEWTGSGFAPEGTIFNNVGLAFFGYLIARSAVAPNGDRCTFFQQLSSGNLVAACLIAGALQTLLLADLDPPSGFNPYIETAAAYLAGYFFFSHFLPSGEVRLARIEAASLAVTLTSLGFLPALLPGDFPSLAMLPGPGGLLFLFWAAHAIALDPVSLLFAQLIGFPFNAVGPLSVALIASLIYVTGAGSTLLTAFDPGAIVLGAPPAPVSESIPTLEIWGMIFLALALAGFAVARFSSTRRIRP